MAATAGLTEVVLYAHALNYLVSMALHSSEAQETARSNAIVRKAWKVPPPRPLPGEVFSPRAPINEMEFVTMNSHPTCPSRSVTDERNAPHHRRRLKIQPMTLERRRPRVNLAEGVVQTLREMQARSSQELASDGLRRGRPWSASFSAQLIHFLRPRVS